MLYLQAKHRQEVDVGEEDEGRVDLLERHVAQQIDRVELAFAVDDVVADVASRPQNLGRLGVT